jgi:hypothetical protein
MKMSKMKFFLPFLTFIALFNACTPEDAKVSGAYSNGVFIVNEGPFTGGAGSVDFYDRQKTVTNDIYAKANNGASIGSILQSMTIYGGKAYLMVNNANKVIVADPNTFINTGDVTTFAYPQFMQPIDKSRAYISEWGKDGINGAVKVFDFELKSVAKTIPLKKLGAGRMLSTGQALWICNDSGLSFPKQDSTVTVIDIGADTIIRSIKVDESPNSIVQDANGEIWVLCAKTLNKIKNNAVEFSIKVPDYSSKLTTDITKNNLYFVNGNKVYQKDLLNFGKNTPSVFLTQPYLVSPYAIGFDPKSGLMYCGDAKNYKSAGKVYIFDPSSKALKDSLTVGIAPNGFVFQ